MLFTFSIHNAHSLYVLNQGASYSYCELIYNAASPLSSPRFTYFFVIVLFSLLTSSCPVQELGGATREGKCKIIPRWLVSKEGEPSNLLPSLGISVSECSS